LVTSWHRGGCPDRRQGDARFQSAALLAHARSLLLAQLAGGLERDLIRGAEAFGLDVAGVGVAPEAASAAGDQVETLTVAATDRVVVVGGLGDGCGDGDSS
jgi:hypothetical protein